ncbi:DUF6236 family protein [Klebsiella oxytoca]|uniref:DUF6236 family protein n=1 Tax=Klebsiella oxytoca TaxID=571 RepID=UPI00388FB7A6|nr:hypothetical protein [Klebsiella oxytoca]HCB2153712.1 hypothetical protein [Klebsiella oxytoca]
MNHGLILTRKMTLKNKGIYIEGGFDPIAVRMAMLYLDKICVPQSRMYGVGLNDELKTLKKENLLFEYTAEYFPVGMVDGQTMLIKAYSECFQKLNEEENENWIVHKSLNAKLERKKITDDNGETFSLINALPIPTAEFPIGDLLEFKLKRRDELKSLLLEIETTRLDIITSENKEAELLKGIIKIEKNLLALNKLMQETKKGFYLSTFTIDFSSKDLLNVFGEVYGAAKDMGMNDLSAFLSSIGASAASMVNVKAGYRFKQGKPNSPYLYAAEVKQKFEFD